MLGLRYFRHVGVIPVCNQREIEAAGCGLPGPAHHDVDARGGRVHAVDEEAPAADAHEPEALEVLAYVRLREVLRQYDAVVDLDAIGVDGDHQLSVAQHRAQREVHRRLGVEQSGAKGLRHRVAYRESRDVKRHAVDEVGGRRGEVLLLQRRRAKAVLQRAAQRERRREVVAAGNLAGETAAEVGVVLVAKRHGAEQSLREVGLEVGEDTDRGTVLVHRVLGPEAREHLGAGGSGLPARQQHATVDV